MSPSTRLWYASLASAFLLVGLLAVAAAMTVVWLAIALWAVVIINGLCRRFAAWLDRPLTDTDRYCAKVDAQLDDELAARRATRPTGNCDVIPFTARTRTRGDAS